MEEPSTNGVGDFDDSQNGSDPELLNCPKDTNRKPSYPELSTSPTELKTEVVNGEKSPELPATPNPSEEENPDEQKLSELMGEFRIDAEPRAVDSGTEVLDGIIDDEVPMEINGVLENLSLDAKDIADDIVSSYTAKKKDAPGTGFSLLSHKTDSADGALPFIGEEAGDMSTLNLDQELKRCQLSIMESKQTMARCCELQEMLREASAAYPSLKRSETPTFRPWRRFSGIKSGGPSRRLSLPIQGTRYSTGSQAADDNGKKTKSVTFKKALTQNDSLQDAVFVGDYEKTKSLIRQGADVNFVDKYGKSICHIASEQGHARLLQYLLQNGAMINDADHCGKTALHYAVESGSAKTVDVILSRGASLNHTDKSMKTPLHIACEKGERSIVEMLLGFKATTLHDLDSNLKSPLHYATEHDHFPVVIHLVKAGAPVNQNDGEHRKPLHYAAAGGFIRIARFLVENGATVDPLDSNLQTPLFLAVTNGFKSIVNYLIFHGASVDISDSRRQTPLHIAAAKGYTEIVNDLVSNNASIDPMDEEGRTPLAIATENQDLAMTTVLLQHGANVDLLKPNLSNSLVCGRESAGNNLAYLLEEFGHSRNYTN